MDTTPNTIEEIVELLVACDDAYFNAFESILTDREYDILKRKAFAIEPSNEYFVKIGSDVRGGKIKLPYSMGSLNQVYEGEVSDWVKKYSLQKQEVVITDKLDGVSCLLVYNGGNLSIAYSRGNGIEGADITRHIKDIPSVPKNIKDVDYLVVRAEIIMKDDVFAEKYSTTYKNSRNMASGMVNRKETDHLVLNDLDVVAYEIVAGNSSTVSMDKFNKKYMLEILKSFGFLIANSTEVFGNKLNDIFLSNVLETARSNSPYTLDGLVITVNDHVSLNLQSNSSSLNPEHSVKFKILTDDAIVETIVVAVHWEVSKNGYLKPVVEIVPVELFGTTVTFATGFNGAYIKNNGIGRGAKVRITKSGMTIPFLVAVTHPVTPSLPKFDIYGGWGFNDSGVEIVVKDKEHPLIVMKQVLDFFEKFKVDLLKEATMTTIWATLPSHKYDDAICDICDYTESEWVKYIGANGSKIYKSLHQRLENATLETFLGGSRYMGVGFGVRKAKALLNGMFDLPNELWMLTVDQIVAKEGFDVKTADMVVTGLPASKTLLERLETMNVIKFVEERKKTMELKDLVVVMTGFRDADLQYRIESKGGKVGSSVSKKTTHVIALTPNSGSGKTQKAIELGITVITPEDFKFEFDL